MGLDKKQRAPRVRWAAAARAERVWVRRRRSFFVSRGLQPRCGCYPRWRRPHPPSPAGMSHLREIPSGQRIPTPSLPGVGGAPRHQPPANHRERLRRTATRAPRDRPSGVRGTRNEGRGTRYGGRETGCGVRGTRNGGRGAGDEVRGAKVRDG